MLSRVVCKIPSVLPSRDRYAVNWKSRILCQRLRLRTRPESNLGFINKYSCVFQFYACKCKRLNTLWSLLFVNYDYNLRQQRTSVEQSVAKISRLLHKFTTMFQNSAFSTATMQGRKFIILWLCCFALHCCCCVMQNAMARRTRTINTRSSRVVRVLQ